MASFIKLEVVAGPDTGRTHDVHDVAIVGRAPTCEIVLSDPAASTQHARINAIPIAKITDLGSANKMSVNGQETLGVDLNEGDIIEIGTTRMRVSFALDAGGASPVRDRAKEKKRKGLLMLAAVGIVAALGLALFGVKLKEQRERENTPLIATKLSGSIPFKNRMTVVFPMQKEGDFNIPTAGVSKISSSTYYNELKRFQKVRADFEKDYAANLERVTPAGTPPDRLDEIEERMALIRKKMHDELSLTQTFPDDPLSRFLKYEERVWKAIPPRLGNGRFVFSGGKYMLGDFRSVRFEVMANGYSNPTPPKLVGGGIPEDMTLYVYFAIDCWDSLPPSMSINFFSLDLPASEDREKYLEFVDKPQIPRFPNLVVARNRWDNSKSSDTAQYAVTEATKKVPKNPALKNEQLDEDDLMPVPLQRIFVREKKVGEMLYVMSAMCFAWQEERLGPLMDNILESQIIPGMKREENPEALVARALELERKAMRIIDTSSFDDDTDFASISDKGKFWMVFNRLTEALMLMQAADKWRNDRDYDRIYEKALRLYRYYQGDTNWFRKRFHDIEDLKRKADDVPVERRKNLEEALKKTDELWKITLSGQEPERYMLDEWFIYAHLTRQRLMQQLERMGSAPS